jgi:hypothetical protein
VLQDFGVKPELLSGFNIAAELALAAGTDVSMDASRGRCGEKAGHYRSRLNGREDTTSLGKEASDGKPLPKP